MPVTRKQKKVRKSRGIEMLSDIDNLDIMLGENHYSRNVRDESVNSNQARGPRSVSRDEFENNGENNYLETGSFPVLVPIMAKIQQEIIQVPRSTGCQVS